MDQSNELAPPVEQKKPRNKPSKLRGWGIYLAMGAGFLIYFLLGRLDDFTELTPDHSATFDVCLGATALLGLVVAVFLFRSLRSSTLSIRLRTALPLGFITAVISFLFLHRIANICEGYIDFPHAGTKTYVALIHISRAYRTHGKSASWNIQTNPFGTNLEIEPADYNFMLAHRSPTDTSQDSDHISSHNYFCAKATFQQSGNALRILHAGSRALPAGTVMICPQSSQ